MTKQAILAVDVGNTRTKCGYYEQGALQWVKMLESATLLESWPEFLHQIAPEVALTVGWMSVSRKIDPNSLSGWDRFETSPKLHWINHEYDFPIQNRYETPETLGTDRIVAVIGALSLTGGGPVLVIDAGTALTYEFADQDGVYLGGGISPGIQMRFKALHHFTARLPRIEFTDTPPLVGDSTEHSIQMGVLQGILGEVGGVIQKYRNHFDAELPVVITGGDAPFFENHLKNINFADSNLNLRGIYHILTV